MICFMIIQSSRTNLIAATNFMFDSTKCSNFKIGFVIDKGFLSNSISMKNSLSGLSGC